MKACKHTIYINFKSGHALYLRVLAKPIIHGCYSLLYDLQIHYIIINIHTQALAILELYRTH